MSQGGPLNFSLADYHLGGPTPAGRRRKPLSVKRKSRGAKKAQPSKATIGDPNVFTVGKKGGRRRSKKSQGTSTPVTAAFGAPGATGATRGSAAAAPAINTLRAENSRLAAENKRLQATYQQAKQVRLPSSCFLPVIQWCLSDSAHTRNIPSSPRRSRTSSDAWSRRPNAVRHVVRIASMRFVGLQHQRRRLSQSRSGIAGGVVVVGRVVASRCNHRSFAFSSVPLA